MSLRERLLRYPGGRRRAAVTVVGCVGLGLLAYAVVAAVDSRSSSAQLPERLQLPFLSRDRDAEAPEPTTTATQQPAVLTATAAATHTTVPTQSVTPGTTPTPPTVGVTPTAPTVGITPTAPTGGITPTVGPGITPTPIGGPGITPTVLSQSGR